MKRKVAIVKISGYFMVICLLMVRYGMDRYLFRFYDDSFQIRFNFNISLRNM